MFIWWRQFVFFQKLTRGGLLNLVILLMIAAALQTFGLAMVALAIDYTQVENYVDNPLVKWVLAFFHLDSIRGFRSEFLSLLGLTTASFVLVSLILFGVELYVNKLATRMGCEIQIDLGERLLQCREHYLMNQSLGHLTNVIANQTVGVSQCFREYVTVIVTFFTTLPFVFGAMLVNSNWLLVMLLALFVPLALLLRGVSWRTFRHARAQVFAMSEKMHFLFHLLTRSEELKATRRTELLLNPYKGAVSAFFAQVRALNFWMAVGNHLVKAVVFTLLCMIVFYQVIMEQQTMMTASVTLAFLYALTGKSVEFYQVYQKWVSTLAAIHAYERLSHQFYKNAGPVSQRYRPLPDETAAGEIRLSQLFYLYPYMEIPVFERLSLAIRTGQFTAITGMHGRGGTTLLHLLSGVITAQQGGIRLPRTLWQGEVGFVPDMPRLLPGTLRDNLTLFRADIPDSAVLSMLEALDLTEMLRRHPHGLDTPVRDMAEPFSAGEIKQLMIARECLVQPPLLLLDHPESHLSEAEIKCAVKVLSAVRKGRSTLCVTEHPAFLGAVDCVIAPHESSDF